MGKSNKAGNSGKGGKKPLIKKHEIIPAENLSDSKPAKKDERVEMKSLEALTQAGSSVSSNVEAPVQEPLSTQPTNDIKPRMEQYLVHAGEYQVINYFEPDQSSNRGRNKAKLQWTPARRKAVAEYIAKLQGILRLRDWEIIIDFEPISIGENAYATITPEIDQRRATLQFSELFFKQPHHALRQTLIHEILHCHFFWMESMVERMLHGVSEEVGRAASPAVTSQVEFIVDSIADAFAPLCPDFELPSR
ncbi:MAG: hypothetical protein ACKOW9_00400 [Candidatus Paceibacterota bacterium]